MPITIDILKNHPESISTLADKWLSSIGQWEPGSSFDDITKWLQEWMNERIPMAFVAFDGIQPVGMCSLQYNDGLSCDLMPWLGDLFVIPEYQHQKIAIQLIDAAKCQAKLQGFDSLYLFAPDKTIPNYYLRIGWQVVGVEHYHGQEVTVMMCEL